MLAALERSLHAKMTGLQRLELLLLENGVQLIRVRGVACLIQFCRMRSVVSPFRIKCCSPHSIVSKKSQIDHLGVSVSAIKLVAAVASDATADVLARTIASTPMMTSVVIHGKAFGKQSSTRDAKGVRAILPCLPLCKYWMCF
jgi:hypothetical protein